MLPRSLGIIAVVCNGDVYGGADKQVDGRAGGTVNGSPQLAVRVGDQDQPVEEVDTGEHQDVAHQLLKQRPS